MKTYKYTICFIISGDEVLMMRRKKPPQLGRCNALGGKIEAGETLEEAVIREVQEETGIGLLVDQLHYAGVITGIDEKDRNNDVHGMHAFLAEIEEKPELAGDALHEGDLVWQKIADALEQHNDAFADNIFMIFPPVLAKREPREYFMWYEDGAIQKLIERAL